MRIFSNDTERYIQSLAAAISRDPASMENWCCLHIAQKEEIPSAWCEATIKKLKDSHKDLDCDVVHCTDSDVLFISRNLQADQLFEIAAELINTINEQTETKANVVLYDLFRDWRTIRELLLAKAGEPKPIATKPVLNNFGEVYALQEIFTEAKKVRKARTPMHVLLVEDDPLTRRLVTGVFKDKYALIASATAGEAIVNYLLHAPDIVFLDIDLPDASGFDVLHSIMENDPDAYVVMFSGNSYLDNVTDALGAGASGFVAKPFKKDKMQRYIEDSALHHRKYA
jgi:CheY-like chemotaxis protein